MKMYKYTEYVSAALAKYKQQKHKNQIWQIHVFSNPYQLDNKSAAGIAWCPATALTSR